MPPGGMMRYRLESAAPTDSRQVASMETRTDPAGVSERYGAAGRDHAVLGSALTRCPDVFASAMRNRLLFGLGRTVLPSQSMVCCAGVMADPVLT